LDEFVVETVDPKVKLLVEADDEAFVVDGALLSPSVLSVVAVEVLLVLPKVNVGADFDSVAVEVPLINKEGAADPVVVEVPPPNNEGVEGPVVEEVPPPNNDADETDVAGLLDGGTVPSFLSVVVVAPPNVKTGADTDPVVPIDVAVAAPNNEGTAPDADVLFIVEGTVSSFFSVTPLDPAKLKVGADVEPIEVVVRLFVELPPNNKGVEPNEDEFVEGGGFVSFLSTTVVEGKENNDVVAVEKEGVDDDDEDIPVPATALVVTPSFFEDAASPNTGVLVDAIFAFPAEAPKLKVGAAEVASFVPPNEIAGVLFETPAPVAATALDPKEKLGAVLDAVFCVAVVATVLEFAPKENAGAVVAVLELAPPNENVGADTAGAAIVPLEEPKAGTDVVEAEPKLGKPPDC